MTAVERMHEAIAAWLDALDSAQRAKATFDFGDTAQRSDWAYFPRAHAGLPLHEQDIRQQKLAQRLLAAALSVPAYAKATAIMALESVLNRSEEYRGDAVRDPGRYFLSIFGAPGDPRWGWRFEGHHVCLNFTVADGRVLSPTPIFLGANPAAVRHGGHAVTRPCGEEEDVARELLASLDGARRDVAVIAPVAPPDFVLANLPSVPDVAETGDAVPAFMRRVADIQAAWDAVPAASATALRFERLRPRGLAGRDMDAWQRALLRALVEVYVARLDDELAGDERSRLDERAIEDLHFAWAGPPDRGAGHYYRLQGGDFLVEYDNTQDDANHVHAVWRDAARDFGGDTLRGHVASDHQG